jgi:glycosyltransferase involved in cell wall biosynthesis
LAESNIEMQCPKIQDLPPPAHGGKGWPWTEETPYLTPTIPDGRPWPRISIVTPSYNQGEFIEETIRSVLLQGYHNLEYIIIDGGSTDQSVDIIKKYEPWLTHWVTEPDKGQAHAINKGFKKATGEIVAWLNSDDVYFPGVLAIAAKLFSDKHTNDIVYGDCEFIDKQGKYIKKNRASRFDMKAFLGKVAIPQPSMFIKKSTLSHVGYLDEKLNYAFDRKFWLKAAINRNNALTYVRRNFSKYRLHGRSKGVAEKHAMDIEISKTVLGILNKKNIPLINEKNREKAKRFHNLTLAFRYWQNNDKKNAEQYFKEAKIISPALLEDEDLVGTVAFNIFVDYIERRDWKDGLRPLKYFYKKIIRPNVPGSNKYLSFLLSHYFFLVALRRRNPYIFLKGMIKSPEYFLRVSLFMIKKCYSMVR